MDATHIHLLLNHVPVLAVPLGLALLVWAGVRRRGEVMRAALAIFVVGAVVAIPVYLTGEPAEETIEGVAPADAFVERHEDAAAIALSCALALGAVALGAIAVQRFRPRLTLHVGVASGALAIVAFTSLAWTASLGGEIRHTEIRAGADSVLAPVGRVDRDRDHDDD